MKKVLFECRSNIAYITINRPEVMNAMDPETYRLLSESWCEVRDNPDIRVAVITGAGEKAFSAGADLKSAIPTRPERYHFWLTQKEMLLNRGLEVWKPVIAAVNGYCLGGGMTLLLATDLRIASEGAVFELSESKRGFFLASGATQRILKQLPYAIAMELILLGRCFSAQEALNWGFVNKVVAGSELMASAEEYAELIKRNAPLAVQALKELVIRSQSLPLEQGLRLEAAISEVIKRTQDAEEGAAAFSQKRPPIFQGR